MKNIFTALAVWFRTVKLNPAQEPGFELNYDNAFHLDAEELAEGDIGKAYETLRPVLEMHLGRPAEVVEHIDDAAPSYTVSSGGVTYRIHGPDLDDTLYDSWARATWALFDSVNRQFAANASPYRLYAIGGGNDLHGLFLVPEDADKARAALPRRADWPYIPTDVPPGYGGPE